MFKKLKENNIHTALDTSGSIPLNNDIIELLKYTDLVLLDIKHINDDKCVDLTGFTNKNTLNFAKYLSDNNIPIWLRQVIVPGVTDDEEDLKKLGDFIKTLSNVQKIDLIPYHEMGKYKWKSLGVTYPLEETRAATQDDIIRVKRILGI